MKTVYETHNGKQTQDTRGMMKILSSTQHIDLSKQKDKWYSLEVISQWDFSTKSIYSEVLKKSPKININELESYLFLYFDTPDVLKVAKKFNSLLWEYSSRFGTNQILFDKIFKWDKETLSNILNI